MEATKSERTVRKNLFDWDGLRESVGPIIDDENFRYLLCLTTGMMVQKYTPTGEKPVRDAMWKLFGKAFCFAGAKEAGELAMRLWEEDKEQDQE